MTRPKPERNARSQPGSAHTAAPFLESDKPQELAVEPDAVARIIALREGKALELEDMEKVDLREYWRKAISEMSNAQIEAFDRKLRDLMIRETSRPAPLPTQAPELYADRPAVNGARETIVDFLNRVYAPWIDGMSMVRADLRRLDSGAAKALENFEFKYGSARAQGIDIPTMSERNTRLIEKGIENEPDAMRRKGLRQLLVQRRHDHKKRTI